MRWMGYKEYILFRMVGFVVLFMIVSTENPIVAVSQLAFTFF